VQDIAGMKKVGWTAECGQAMFSAIWVSRDIEPQGVDAGFRAFAGK
jgi:hypothetical protein